MRKFTIVCIVIIAMLFVGIAPANANSRYKNVHCKVLSTTSETVHVYPYPNTVLARVKGPGLLTIITVTKRCRGKMVVSTVYIYGGQVVHII